MLNHVVNRKGLVFGSLLVLSMSVLWDQGKATRRAIIDTRPRQTVMHRTLTEGKLLASLIAHDIVIVAGVANIAIFGLLN